MKTVFKQFLKSDFFYPVSYGLLYVSLYVFYSYVTKYNTGTVEGFFAVFGLSIFTLLVVVCPAQAIANMIQISRLQKRAERTLRELKQSRGEK